MTTEAIRLDVLVGQLRALCEAGCIYAGEVATAIESACKRAEFWKANHLAGNEEIDRMRAERDAWKEVAEHQHGLLRAVLSGGLEMGCPVGVLDAWAAGRHPVLAGNAKLCGERSEPERAPG
jgi:hypothetical protein